jgi:uncharacterized iron-regulated protein
MVNRSKLFALAAVGSLVISFAPVASAKPAAEGAQCLEPGRWARVDSVPAQTLDGGAILAAMAQRDVLLLGEQHDDMDHHRWQLHTLAALHAQRLDMQIGFEMFPRRVQPVLDRWVAGELSERQFLEQVEWDKVWSMPAELYLPLLHFARINRIPIKALNVESSLTRSVAMRGWNAVPEAEREGVGRAAEPPQAYVDFLFDVHRQHGQMHAGGAERIGRKDAAFRFFVESQLTWDRAMAEALVAIGQDARRLGNPPPLAVGIMGSGHVRFGHGVPHQLRALGVGEVGTLMPLDAETACAELQPGLADAVFVLPQQIQSAPPPPRLGVTLEEHPQGVRIAAVVAGSLGEKSGLVAGDIITLAGGVAMKRSIEFVGLVRQQPPGTWLPLNLLREGSVLELVVKFPAER